jgi:hypothetical protein
MLGSFGQIPLVLFRPHSSNLERAPPSPEPSIPVRLAAWLISASSASRSPKSIIPHSIISKHMNRSTEFSGLMSPKPTVENI